MFLTMQPKKAEEQSLRREGLSGSRTPAGCFHKLGVLFVGVLVISAVVCWVYVFLGPLIFGKLPTAFGCKPRSRWAETFSISVSGLPSDGFCNWHKPLHSPGFGK